MNGFRTERKELRGLQMRNDYKKNLNNNISDNTVNVRDVERDDLDTISDGSGTQNWIFR